MATPKNPVIPGYTPSDTANCVETAIRGNGGEIIDLPALISKTSEREVISRWGLTPEERLMAYLTGDIYLKVCTYGHPLHPQLIQTERPKVLGDSMEEETPLTSMERSGPQVSLRVLLDVLAEKRSQLRKWGYGGNNPADWLSILVEEVGEAAKANLHDKFGGDKMGTLRGELIQVAATAISWLETIDSPEHHPEDTLRPFAASVDEALFQMVNSWGAPSIIGALSLAVSPSNPMLALSLQALANSSRVGDVREGLQKMLEGANDAVKKAGEVTPFDTTRQSHDVTPEPAPPTWGALADELVSKPEPAQKPKPHLDDLSAEGRFS